MFVRLLAFALLISVSPTMADFAAGKRAYELGDYALAFREWLPLAEAGNVDAQRRLGNLYFFGEGVDESEAVGIRWYRRAAEQGDAKAQALLERSLGYVPEAELWYRKCDSRLRKLAQSGDAEAQFLMYYHLRNAWEYITGENGMLEGFKLSSASPKFKEIVQERFTWLQKAAEKGYPDAELDMGVEVQIGPFADGRGLDPDYTGAAKWYRRAAEHGNRGAQVELASSYAQGLGLPQSFEEAASWYRRAAERGERGAKFEIASYYFEGKGVQQNYTEAFNWWHSLFIQGPPAKQVDYDLDSHLADQYVTAKMKLGEMYIKGMGVRQNIQEGVRLYREARPESVQQKLNELFYEQGGAYRWGNGVPQDDNQAVPWFRMAAAGSYPLAQVQLGLEYYSGRGVPKDYVQAHMWFNLAAATGNADAVTMRAIIEKRMTPDQIAEAQRMAREWRPQLLATTPATPSTATNTEPASSGTGFFVSREGHILTNYHVVEGCQSINTQLAGKRTGLNLLGKDEKNDLAILKFSLPIGNHPFASMAAGRVKVGQMVIAVGYPLRGILASSASVTTGTVSALAGVHDDTRMLQISTPIQPGNSGGPLLDESGNMVGVIVAKLDALKIAEATGDIAENVNFAIRNSVVEAFLDANGIVYVSAPSATKLDSTVISERARRFTVVVECWK